MAFIVYGPFELNIATALLALIASVMEVGASDVNEDSSSSTIPKWDSMRQLMLASMLESEYGIALADEDLLNLQSVKKVRAVLTRHGISDR